MKFHAVLALFASTAFAAPVLLGRDPPPRSNQNGPYDVAGAIGDLGHEVQHQAGHVGQDIVKGVEAVPKAVAGGLAGIADATTDAMKGFDSLMGGRKEGGRGYGQGQGQGQAQPRPFGDNPYGRPGY